MRHGSRRCVTDRQSGGRAAAAAKATATTAVKDAYVGLKALLTRRRVDVTGWNANPTPPEFGICYKADLAS